MKTAWSLPASVRVLGKTIPVKARRHRGNTSLYGRFNLTTGTIKIQADLCQSEAEDTLLHEILHVLEMKLGVDIKEADHCRLTSALYGLISEGGLDWLFRKNPLWPSSALGKRADLLIADLPVIEDVEAVKAQIRADAK